MLDLGLPDLDGYDVLAMLRASSYVPVVIATARDDERERKCHGAEERRWK